MFFHERVNLKPRPRKQLCWTNYTHRPMNLITKSNAVFVCVGVFQFFPQRQQSFIRWHNHIPLVKPVATQSASNSHPTSNWPHSGRSSWPETQCWKEARARSTTCLYDATSLRSAIECTRIWLQRQYGQAHICCFIDVNMLYSETWHATRFEIGAIDMGFPFFPPHLQHTLS